MNMREYINQIGTMQYAIDIANSPGVREMLTFANSPAITQMYQSANIARSMAEPVLTMQDQLSILSDAASNCLSGLLSENVLELYQSMSQSISENMQVIRLFYENGHLITSFQQLGGVLSNYNLINCNSDRLSDREAAKNEKINKKIVTKIFTQEETDKNIHKEESPIIPLSPINDRVLKYLSENPESFYQLTDNDFEIVMAEIYSKLGYDVTRTKVTRDGGKDLIIRIPEVLGDFIYYVECKKYAAKRPIGVGIIRNLVGTVSTDRVNGGILATTSFFSRDAEKFILNNKWNCQIKTHDYNVIRDLLKQVVTSA